MSNICTFGIETVGEPNRLRALKRFIEPGIEQLENATFERYILNIDGLFDDLGDNDHKFIWLDDDVPGAPYCKQFTVTEGPVWFSADRSQMLRHGTAKYAPPQRLVERLSLAFPDLDFTFGGTSEHEVSENWTCKAGVSKCVYYVKLDIQAGEEMWFVRDGQEVPLEWIDGDTEEMAELEAKLNVLMQKRVGRPEFGR